MGVVTDSAIAEVNTHQNYAHLRTKACLNTFAINQYLVIYEISVTHSINYSLLIYIHIIFYVFAPVLLLKNNYQGTFRDI